MNILNKKERRCEYMYYVVLLLFTLGLGYISLGKGFNFDVYSGFSGDETFGMMLVKSINENGPLGVWFNSRVGAPETSTIIDYPVLGNMMVLLLWVISWFTDSIPGILYTYLILTFALDGISMSLLLRKLNINRFVSFVICILFAAAPFHFYRYLAHSSLINYMYVPIAIYLSLVILNYFNDEKKWKIIFCILLLGLGYGYYYAFGLIMMFVAFIMYFIQVEDKKKLIKKIWIIISLLITILLTLLPKIAYSFINGNNQEAGKRLFYESEIYGLKIINLLLPVQYSRIIALRELTNEYCLSGAPLVTENSMASLGLIGAIGFISLCVAFIISFTKKKENTTLQKKVIDFLCLETLVFVLTASIGGFGEIFNWAVTSQIRCYNRCSIFLTGLSLIMIAIMLNAVFAWKRPFAVGLTILVLGIGLYDQVAIRSDSWQTTSGIDQTQVMYEEYFEIVEDALEDSAMVYQLPYMDFPEAATINDLVDYKHFIAYLFTDNIRWSYGATRGRNVLAKDLNVDNGMSYAFVKGIQRAGFQAVYIDLDGYADDGSEIINFYNGLGIQPLISDDGKLYVYDISNVEISDEQLLPGYMLVSVWNDLYGTNYGEKELAGIAEGLIVGDETALDKIYSMFSSSDEIQLMSDGEFVDWLYITLLQRYADENGHNLWVEALESGSTRRDLIFSFLCCDEFRSVGGLAQ